MGVLTCFNFRRENSWLHKAQAGMKHPEADSGEIWRQNTGISPGVDYKSTQWFWLAYIFLEIPAQNVTLAFSNLRPSSEHSWTEAVLYVFKGTVSLPIYGFSRLAQIGVLSFTSLVKVSG